MSLEAVVVGFRRRHVLKSIQTVFNTEANRTVMGLSWFNRDSHGLGDSHCFDDG